MTGVQTCALPIYGGQAIIAIAPLFVCISVLLNIFSLSGVLVTVSGLITDLGTENLIGAILIAAVIPILLGMAVTAVAAYILSVGIIAPALLALGFEEVPLHMFIFYISSLAPITPPIATAAFVAAGIAQANWFKVSVVAVKLAIVAFLLPFFFIFDPALLGLAPFDEVLQVTITGIFGTILLSSSLFGYLLGRINILTRGLFLCGGILMLFPGSTSDFWGFVLAGLGIGLVPIVKKVSVLFVRAK